MTKSNVELVVSLFIGQAGSQRGEVMRLSAVWSCAVLSLIGFMSATSICFAQEYIGAKACADCHDAQYTSFVKNSKKVHSWDSIAIMKPKLTEAELKECYECHTTGYGKPGGFVSPEKTPDRAFVGCETCHGPGSKHAESGDTKLITRKPEIKTCTVCHNAQRVEDFHFKPLLYSGAH